MAKRLRIPVLLHAGPTPLNLLLANKQFPDTKRLALSEKQRGAPPLEP